MIFSVLAVGAYLVPSGLIRTTNAGITSGTARLPAVAMVEGTTSDLAMLAKSKLLASPGWTDGKGVSLDALSELIDEWESDQDDDAFYDALDLLEEEGWLRIDNGDSDDDDDMIYAASANKLAEVTRGTYSDAMTPAPAEANAYEASLVRAAEEKLMGVVQAALVAQAGWESGAGVTLGDLQDLIDEWKSDDDDDLFYDAIDALEERGYLRVDNGEEEDTLFKVLASDAAADPGEKPN